MVATCRDDEEEERVDDVLQCPHCDLKFGSRADLQQHIAFDHPNKDQPQGNG